MSIEDLLPAALADRIALLEHIYARCHDDAGCLVWDGALNGDGHSMIRMRQRTTPVRRVVHWLAIGPLAPSLHAAMTCECRQCIEPEHMAALTHQQLMQLRARQGRLASPVRGAKSARYGRARSRWSDADIADFRASTGTLAERAARFGMSLSYAHQLSHGHWRKPIASPWAGMGQRR